MRERVRVFVALAIFWLAFMLVARAIFLIYNADLTASLTTREILLTMMHGFRMDASISGYFLAASGRAVSGPMDCSCSSIPHASTDHCIRFDHHERYGTLPALGFSNEYHTAHVYGERSDGECPFVGVLEDRLYISTAVSIFWLVISKVYFQKIA
jgi:hypothetical protein